MAVKAAKIRLTEKQQQILEETHRSSTSEKRLVERSGF